MNIYQVMFSPLMNDPIERKDNPIQCSFREKDVNWGFNIAGFRSSINCDFINRLLLSIEGCNSHCISFKLVSIDIHVSKESEFPIHKVSSILELERIINERELRQDEILYIRFTINYGFEQLQTMENSISISYSKYGWVLTFGIIDFYHFIRMDGNLQEQFWEKIVLILLPSIFSCSCGKIGQVSITTEWGDEISNRGYWYYLEEMYDNPRKLQLTLANFFDGKLSGELKFSSLEETPHYHISKVDNDSFVFYLNASKLQLKEYSSSGNRFSINNNNYIRYIKEAEKAIFSNL